MLAGTIRMQNTCFHDENCIDVLTHPLLSQCTHRMCSFCVLMSPHLFSDVWFLKANVVFLNLRHDINNLLVWVKKVVRASAYVLTLIFRI